MHAHTVCYLDNPKHEVRMKTCGGNMFGRVRPMSVTRSGSEQEPAADRFALSSRG